jgi:hypothetical protein
MVKSTTLVICNLSVLSTVVKHASELIEESVEGIVHCKKRLATFPSPAGMSLTKISLGGKNLIIPSKREFGK